MATLIVLFFTKKIRADLNIYTFLHYIEEDTKKFIFYFIIIFLGFLISSKFQLKIIERLLDEYPRMMKVLKYITILLICFAASFVVNYYFQYYQNKMDPVSTVTWIEEKDKIFFAGILYLFFIFMFMFALFGNVYISTLITSSILFVLGYIHYTKLSLRVEPLYPSDYKQLNQLKDVIPWVKEYLSMGQFLLLFILLIGFFILIFILPKLKISVWERGGILVIALMMIYSFTYFPDTFMKSFVEKYDIEIVKWNQLYNYQYNGFLFGFVSNLQNDVFEEPEGYSKQSVLKTAQNYVKSTEATTKQNNVEKPNIIYVMSEAFWDPTNLPIEFSEDPIKHVRQLMTEYSSGKVLSPNFGGGTANVEFEALTGLTMTFLSEGAIPYQDLVPQKKFIPTIVSDLENKGYESLAIHPGSKYFYRRNNVFETFGFNKFLAEGTIIQNERNGQGLINDKSITIEILDNIKNQEKALFIHTVTIQNHMPYDQKTYEDTEITVTGLREESLSPLRIYTEGIRRSDQAFQLLVNELEKIDEPTIVVFWGDHLPILGSDYGIYKEAGYYDETLKEGDIKFYQTPLLIYSNFDTEKENLKTISPIYFAPMVYEMSGLEKPPFYHLLDQLRDEIPAMKGLTKLNPDMELITKLTKKQKQLLEDYKLIEYDLLMGKQYSKDLLFLKD